MLSLPLASCRQNNSTLPASSMAMAGCSGTSEALSARYGELQVPESKRDAQRLLAVLSLCIHATAARLPRIETASEIAEVDVAELEFSSSVALPQVSVAAS